MSGAQTMGGLLRHHARRKPHEPALLSEHIRWTWSELDHQVDRMVRYLSGRGIRSGDAVGAVLHKRPEMVVVFLALARMGAIYAPINFKLHADKVRSQFESGGIRSVVTESAFDDVLDDLLADISYELAVIDIGGLAPRDEDPSSVIEGPMMSDAGSPSGPDTVCYFNYTSGTTGAPKGAVTTHGNLVANAEATTRAMGMQETDVYLGMFSVFAHPHELFHRALLLGTPFVILDTMSPRVVAEAVDRFQIRWIMAVPSFYEMMVDYLCDKMSSRAHDLSSLRVLEAGGAYVPETTLERIEELLPARFVPVWGCTEATGVAIANGPEERRRGSTGRAMPGYDVRVVDASGQDVPVGDVGEMILRGPAMTSGYVRNAEETERLYRGGWYYTQDLVTQDEEGWFFFVGRKSEMLKIGGIRVSPLEIERVIGLHPAIVDVVVVRAEERIRGEVARAVVATHSGSTLSARELKAHCREHMAGYKVPRIVEFWNSVPRMANGKFDKAAIVAVEPDPSRDERGRDDPSTA